jgi:hypothetical protein
MLSSVVTERQVRGPLANGPSEMDALMKDPDQRKVERAMLKMSKLDMALLKKAAAGE